MDEQLEFRIHYLSYVGCAVAPLSILGSSLTLRAIYYQYYSKNDHTNAAVERTRLGGSSRNLHSQRQRQRHTHKMTTYQRLLAGISIFDIIFSIPWALGPLPLPVPEEGGGIIPGYGNTQTCTAQGFFIQLGFCSFIYSHQLMLYFVLVIRYNVREAFMVTYIEPMLHAVPILYGVVTAFLGLSWQVFNSAGVQCWVAGYPLGCEEDDSEEACIRGGNKVGIFGNWLVVFPFIFFVGFFMLWTLVIAVTVYQRHRSRVSFMFGRGGTADASFRISSLNSSLPQQPSTTTISASSPTTQQMQTRRQSSVARSTNQNNNNNNALTQAMIQALLYGFWFFNFSIWTLLAHIYYVLGKDFISVGDQFWMAAIAQSLIPLQGLFNFVIYIRPIYLSVRQAYPTQGRWFAVKEAVLRPFATSMERAQSPGVASSTLRKSSSNVQPTPLQHQQQGPDNGDHGNHHNDDKDDEGPGGRSCHEDKDSAHDGEQGTGVERPSVECLALGAESMGSFCEDDDSGDIDCGFNDDNQGGDEVTMNQHPIGVASSSHDAKNLHGSNNHDRDNHHNDQPPEQAAASGDSSLFRRGDPTDTIDDPEDMGQLELQA